MKKVGGLILCLFFSFIYACADKGQSSAEYTAKEFLKALKDQDVSKMQSLYPNVMSIEIFYASDTSYIQSVEPLPKKAYKVNAVSKYVNDKGSMETRKVALVLYPANAESAVSYLITDSYGLTSLENYPHFKFAVNTGCLKDMPNMTDQQAITQLKIAKEMMFLIAKQMYKDLNSNIRIVSSTITKKEANKAYGKAVVENKSDYSLPDLKYMIVYYDENNRRIGVDKGWVTQSTIESGKSVTFDFVSNYVKQAHNASFQIDFDIDLILRFVLEDDIYTGKEYDAFVNKAQIEI